jgi:hypothetical protein
MTPAQRVGKMANLVIFLGILYTVLHLVALCGSAGLAARGYGWSGLPVALGIIGLGYGIRYSSAVCLYTATGVFALLTGFNGSRLFSHLMFGQAVRLLLSAWTLYGLCRALPAMSILKKTHAVPVRTSRYGDLFLRRGMKS